ncbi:acyl-CoA dehydrogenase family protein [Rhodoferax sp.]|uniref:acyl-CoA dehydrogenase family protein n=1 Tax=Rhodoferax sp. TaxID=50421 RepID=UPI0025F7B1ED|nr:acyl-CoA dehydrogenase family protein [Rhodoferax sp.]
MNASLNPGQLARTLAVEFAARAYAHDRDASFPFDNFAELQQAGLLALAAPRHLGGQGATLAQLGEVIGAVGYGCPATALVLVMQYIQHRSMGQTSKAGRTWPPHLAERLVRESVSSVSLINALRVEPELGSPARGGLPSTTARWTPDGWRVSGHKLYSTGAPILRWYAVWVRTDEPAPRVGTLRVPAGLPGTRIVETWDHLGLRASGSHDVVFDDVLVDLDNAIDLREPQAWGGVDAGLQADMAVLLGALYTGIARAARDVDTGTPVSATDSGLLKSLLTNHAVQAVEAALSLAGNHGLSRHHPLQRHLRDVLCGRIHTPQDDSARIAAGRQILIS